MSVDASIVFLPRFTTLAGATTFLTIPVDVSQFAGAQFQVWRSPIRVRTGSGAMTVTFEESLDTRTWVLGPNTAMPWTIETDTPKMFSYSFRLRWFRLKVELTGLDPLVTTWAEGLLRGGGSGLWGAAPQTHGQHANLVSSTGRASPASMPMFPGRAGPPVLPSHGPARLPGTVGKL